MQKTISSVLLLLSLLLLALSTSSSAGKFLSAFPPFCSTPDATLPQKQTYSGKDFSLPSSKSTPSRMYAKSYCLIDADTKRVLYGKDENNKMPMASTTKIMTCIIALEKGDLKSKVPVSAYAASMPDVQLNMQSGDSFYLKDLLYSLMLESHNDTAVAIAEHIGGSVEGFAELMNKKAAELGCHDTHFVTPNGLDAKEHYTTARELCIIASYAIQNKTFLKIINTPSHQFANCKGSRKYSVHNHDAFLNSYPGAIGIKTGFTGTAGYCFCGAAKRNGKTLISSVLACGWPPNKRYKWSDTKKLMDYGFTNFNTVSLKRQKLPDTLPVIKGTKNTLSIKRTNKNPLTLMLCRSDKITTKLNLPETLKAPVRQGDILGYEEYYLNGELLSQSPVIAGETVQERDFDYYKNIVRKLFFWDTELSDSQTYQ